MNQVNTNEAVVATPSEEARESVDFDVVSGDANLPVVIEGSDEEVATPTPPEAKPIDLSSLDVNEKYALILHSVKSNGPNFFLDVNPSAFKLPDRDPLNLIWINMLTAWQIASTILSQFEANVQGMAALAAETEGLDNADGEDRESLAETDASGEDTPDTEVSREDTEPAKAGFNA